MAAIYANTSSGYRKIRALNSRTASGWKKSQASSLKIFGSFFDVQWSNYAITCGQNTNNYNAWAPNNLQYDSVNDAFLILQCHSNKHLYGTYSSWTLSRIYPDEPWRADNIGLPASNGLGMLWIENGVWYVLPRKSTTAYRSADMGGSWESFTTNLEAPLWGIYKCNGVYYSGDDTTTDRYYTSTDLITWETHTFGFSESYASLMEASFCWYKDHVWAFLRTNDAELGHPVVLKSVDGLAWEFVSDSILHAYRSMVSCYPYKDHIILADIDRDNGILYYSRFDGETVEVLNEWNVGAGGDDFHCPCICSDGKGTVIIEFMCHSWTQTGFGSRHQQYYCENTMLIGKTNASTLHKVSFETLPVTDAESYVAEHFDVYPADASLTYTGTKVSAGTAGEYVAALVWKDMNVFAKTTQNEFFYHGNTVVSHLNSESPSIWASAPNEGHDASLWARLYISDKLYSYYYSGEDTLPILQLRTVEKEYPITPRNDSYPQISNALASTAELGLTKQIPLEARIFKDVTLVEHMRITFA